MPRVFSLAAAGTARITRLAVAMEKASSTPRVPGEEPTFPCIAEGFAPAWAEPCQYVGTNAPPLFELMLDRGFTVRVQVKDSETEQPIPAPN